MDEEKKEAQRQRFAYREQENKKEFIRIVNLTKETFAKYGWAKYVATDEDGKIYAYSDRPGMKYDRNWATGGFFKVKCITTDQALSLCGRVPEWNDMYPTPVKR